MNILVTNKQQNKLTNLGVEILKNITGEYDVKSLKSMFQNTYFETLILDATSLKNYKDINTYKDLLVDMNPEKLILLLEENTEMCTPEFLSKLIDMGIYNFTTNTTGIKYLLAKPNTFKQVEHIYKMAHINDNQQVGTNLSIETHSIIGIKNITEHAGATTLTYMLKKQLEKNNKSVIAIELNKQDFKYFKTNGMISITPDKLRETLEKYKNANVIIIDYGEEPITDKVDLYYLIEPTTIKLNKLMYTNRQILSTLKNQKVILNKSELTEKDIYEFEYESGLKICYSMPSVDDRKDSEYINKLLSKMNLIEKAPEKTANTKIFGLFRR